MTRFLKSTFALSLLLCLLCTVACSGGIDTDSAKTFIGEFLDKIGSGDISGANTYLHPDLPLQLDSYLEDVEDAYKISFADGITVERQTGFRYAYYDSKVGGSLYEQSMRAKIGTTTVYITVTVVQNETGYGVYNLDMDT